MLKASLELAGDFLKLILVYSEILDNRQVAKVTLLKFRHYLFKGQAYKCQTM